MKTTRRAILKAGAGAAGLLLMTGKVSAGGINEHETAGLLGITLVGDAPSAGAFPLVASQRAAPLWCDKDDFAGVIRAVGDLQTDTEKVTGIKPEVTFSRPEARCVVIIGTVGRSAPIDGLIATGKLEVSDLRGKWETFLIATVQNPIPNVDIALVIAGSDRRGTIYGVYEISEQLGVSPWYWWADVPVRTRPNAYIRPGRFASGEPAVRYRGIFINDEAPCMTRWTDEKFGGFNSKMYTHMFELLLRLRANYLWPAMWDSAFNEDDSDNPRLADEYGIVMGTSHHEPMIRAQKEWTKSHARYGNGEWNYATNAEGLKSFWSEGIRRNKAYESLVTIGMRGDGDLAKPSAGGLQADILQLESIMADQRQILKRELNTDITRVPQLWALFTEVQKIYDAGVKVPDDVTLLFTDDNVGNLRRLPTPVERGRSGGAGIYYHFDMHGGPYAYQWINTNPFPKIWEQMTLAHEYGADRIWIANVGDLKPLELPIEFFLRMAWNPRGLSRDQIGEYTRQWASRDFGSEYAPEIADIVSRYTKYNGWRKPEVVAPDTYSLINNREAERVEAAWDDIIQRAEALHASLPLNCQDAFYQLVLHPAKASGLVTKLNIAAGRSQLYARQGRASANAQAERARGLFRQDKDLSDHYNHVLAGGKWNHMMDQPHLGEYDWQPPRVNMLPPISEVIVEDNDDFGVAIEGDPSAWPEHYGDAVLPPFDSLNPGRSYFEIFAQGARTPIFKITPKAPWISITADTAPRSDQRYWVEVDWSLLPAGESRGIVDISGSGSARGSKPRSVQIHVVAVKASSAVYGQAKGTFASQTGAIAIAASQATARTTEDGVSWQAIPDYGRGDAAMSIYPVTTKSFEAPHVGPQLHYWVYLPRSGPYVVDVILGPCMDFCPERGMRIGVSFDNDPVQVIDIFADRKAQTFLGPGWLQAAKDNIRTATSTHDILKPGRHDLIISMIDPGLVVQKLIVHDGDLPPSYFGPVENRLV